MDPLLGEIRLFPYSTIPAGWSACDGTMLKIQQNSALYSLLGTKFGGDGKLTFALPDLRGRVPVGSDPADLRYHTGASGGAEAVPITAAQMPLHQHSFRVSAQAGTTTTTTDSVYAAVLKPSEHKLYAPMSDPSVPIEPTALLPAGKSLPHNNMQPYIVMRYCIATLGTYPARP